jgi:glycosyltransferase involved in cell wall biosynthesis
MKIAITKVLNDKGPGLFTQRLFKQLANMPDVRIVGLRDNPDILFCVILLDGPTKAKRVLRIDGLYWDAARSHRNSRIFQGVKAADGVVYQSEFCKNCYSHFIGDVKKSSVIYNGIDQTWVNQVPPAELTHGPGFVACSAWRPLKRYHSICNGFIEADLPSHLYMVGKLPPDPIKHPKISWLGSVSDDKVISIMKSCSYSIHIAKFDSCPNAVVEALSCGLPVLHSANGGTPELVKEDGIKMPIDTPWDYSILKDPNYDKLSSSMVAEYITKLYNFKQQVNRPDLDISIVAKNYYNFFVKVLS